MRERTLTLRAGDCFWTSDERDYLFLCGGGLRRHVAVPAGTASITAVTFRSAPQSNGDCFDIRPDGSLVGVELLGVAAMRWLRKSYRAGDHVVRIEY